MFLDLGIQARDDALQTAQSFQELRICWLAALARGATGTGEDAFYFGASAVGAWMSLVALDLHNGNAKVSGCAMLIVHTDYSPFVGGMSRTIGGSARDRRRQNDR